MTSALSTTAMVLAAGQGLRMRPLTLEAPKPLLNVGGRAMLDLALDKLADAGIKRAVVNTWYLAQQIEDHLKARKDMEIIISREEELLETGGGIANARRHFDAPFFALNADLPWIDEGEASLSRMAAAWNPEKMDALLLVMRTKKARGFSPEGDYAMESGGTLRRKDLPPPRAFVMMAAQILRPELFENPLDRKFSNRAIWDSAEARGRLYGIEHQGTCYHVGTPEDLTTANSLLDSGEGWAA